MYSTWWKSCGQVQYSASPVLFLPLNSHLTLYILYRLTVAYKILRLYAKKPKHDNKWCQTVCGVDKWHLMVISIFACLAFVSAHPCHDHVATLIKSRNLLMGKTIEQEQQWLCSIMKTEMPKCSSHNQDAVVAEQWVSSISSYKISFYFWQHFKSFHFIRLPNASINRVVLMQIMRLFQIVNLAVLTPG